MSITTGPFYPDPARIRHTVGCTLVIAPSHAMVPFENDDTRCLSNDGLELTENVADQYEDAIDWLEREFNSEFKAYMGPTVYTMQTLFELFRGMLTAMHFDMRLIPPLGLKLDLREISGNWYYERKNGGFRLGENIREAYRNPSLFGAETGTLKRYFEGLHEFVVDPTVTLKVVCLKEPVVSFYLLSRGFETLRLGLQPCQAFAVFHNGARVVWVERFNPRDPNFDSAQATLNENGGDEDMYNTPDDEGEKKIVSVAR